VDSDFVSAAVVTKNTTIDEIYQRLIDLGLVPSDGRSYLYFTVETRRISWEDTLEALDIGPLSHLNLRMTRLGGANGSASIPSRAP
jgi:hypothetical protein